ncbi:MAG: hypothetical protein JWM80_3129, partial [Cyanobacteria bacterium RYN_339]|nr:hypothetical protein [Cyanobacteria bacterium RYN_339]
QKLAQQQGILATRENYDAFMKEAQALEATKALGPGSADPASITELQNLLKQWGYAVTPNGQFDQATVAAVLQFKKASNLPASYKMADGTQGYHPFIDQATKQAMIAKLQGVAPAPVAPAAVPPPVVNNAQPLTADELNIATQQGIDPSRANFNAFMTEAQTLEANNALGPGSADTKSVTELQTLLKQWGLPVNVTGQWDQATTDAVLSFKRAAGLHANYKLKDGSFAFHPFIDEATKAAMVKKLQG